MFERDSKRHLLAMFADLQRDIREYFRQSGAVEVFPRFIVPNPGMEPNITPFALLERPASGLGNARRFLHTSPEFAIKSELSQLDGDAFCITRTFRDEPSSPIHQQEFTMLEWYRRDSDYETLIDDVMSIIRWVYGHLTRLPDDEAYDPFRDDWIPDDPFPEGYVRITYAEACEKYVGVDAHCSDPAIWAAALDRGGVHVEDREDLELIESIAMTQLIEPNFATCYGPVFLVDFPIRHAALARAKADDPRVAERVECYLPWEDSSGSGHGLELANGFSELVDPEVQRRRFAADAKRHAALGQIPRGPINHVTNGISRLGETAGMALGVDRLMLWLVWYLFGDKITISDLYVGPKS